MLSVIAVPPKETIVEQLELNNISVEEFAERMETSVGFAEMLVYSIVPITKDVAKKLEKALGIHAQFWLNLESIYQQNLIVVQHQHMKQYKKNRKNGF